MASVALRVREIGSNLKTCQTASELSNVLSSARQLLEDRNAASKAEFFSKHFSTFCQTYLCADNVLRLLPELDPQIREDGFAKFFALGPPCESLLTLCDSFRKCRSSFGMLYLLGLLERFINGECLFKLLSELDVADPNSERSQSLLGSAGSCGSSSLILDHAIVQLCSLPEVVANKLGSHHDRSFFFQENYFTTVGKSILLVMRHVYKQLSESHDCSLKLVCRLVNKVCLRGHTEILLSTILPELCENMRTDFLWRRIGHRLVSGLDDRPLEPVLDFLVSILEPSLVKGGPLHWLLGDAILDRTHVCYILTNKFVFSRQHFSLPALHNIFSCLFLTNNGAGLAEKVFVKILDVWCDSNSVQHTSYEQHRHLTRALLLCVSCLSGNSIDAVKLECVAKLLDGVHVHLSSPIEKTRSLGMVAAELLTMKLQMSVEKLRFEYTVTEDCAALQQLILTREQQAAHFKYCPEKQTFQRSSKLFEIAGNSTPAPSPTAAQDKESNGPTSKVKPSSSASTSASQQPSSAATQVEVLDSDDDSDLEAFPLDEDDMAEKRKDVGEGKPPVFLRDCIAGLVAREKPVRTTTCLASATGLIRRNPPELSEVSGELIKILLHLSDEYSMDDFHACRFQAMVAVVVYCPRPAVEYLTGEFYAVNYNLRQRMDMLDVMERAAQELSSPTKSAAASSAASNSLISIARAGDLPSSNDITATFASTGFASKHTGSSMAMALSAPSRPETGQDWRETVEKRIAQKTRRFAHATGQAPRAVASRFSAVAGFFFYPLMAKFDSGFSTLNLLGSDFVVLGRLIFTLGSILHCAAHCPAARAMAGTLLEFLWNLREHGEPFVRQSVLFAHCMILCSVDDRFLLEDHPGELADCHFWIADTITSDPDQECRRLACHAMPMLEHILSRGVPRLSS